MGGGWREVNAAARIVTLAAVALSCTAAVAGAQPAREKWDHSFQAAAQDSSLKSGQSIRPVAPKPEIWDRSIELSGNYLFGNSDQAFLSTRAGFGRRDSTIAMRVDVRYLIGVTDRASEGRVMDRRSWIVSTSADYRPYSSESQFFFGSIERSLELRIDRRLSGGVGDKHTFINDSVTKDRLDVSVAILGELSLLPQATATGGPPLPALRASLARLSGRFRYRKRLSPRVGLDNTSWYRPELAALNRFLSSSMSVLSYELGKRTDLQIRFEHDYDSMARSRGARSNHNGQMSVGVKTKI